MYSIADYWTMLADRRRRDAYADALRESVKPGMVVVNIGAGTGIFAFMACQLGARRVYAIEPDEIIEVAKALAAANGFNDRIEFIQAMSTDVTLPERAEVIVSDLRGVLPLLGHHLPSIVDAKRRFLTPGGVLIPKRDELWTALVEAPDLYERLVAPWGSSAHDLDWQPARRLAASRWSKVRVRPDQLVGRPQLWTTLEYGREGTPNMSAEVSWVIDSPRLAHGLCVWFSSTLVDGVSLSTAPGEPALVYGTGFFPWMEPVALARDDVVVVDLSATLVGDDYVWRWVCRVHEGGRTTDRPLKAEFDQSNFSATLLSTTRLRQTSVDYAPSLNESGAVDHAILSMMTGGESISRIAEHISERFPTRYPTPADALARVQRLSQRYGGSD